MARRVRCCIGVFGLLGLINVLVGLSSLGHIGEWSHQIATTKEWGQLPWNASPEQLAQIRAAAVDINPSEADFVLFNRLTVMVVTTIILGFVFLCMCKTAVWAQKSTSECALKFAVCKTICAFLIFLICYGVIRNSSHVVMEVAEQVTNNGTVPAYDYHVPAVKNETVGEPQIGTYDPYSRGHRVGADPVVNLTNSTTTVVEKMSPRERYTGFDDLNTTIAAQNQTESEDDEEWDRHSLRGLMDETAVICWSMNVLGVIMLVHLSNLKQLKDCYVQIGQFKKAKERAAKMLAEQNSVIVESVVAPEVVEILDTAPELNSIANESTFSYEYAEPLIVKGGTNSINTAIQMD